MSKTRILVVDDEGIVALSIQMKLKNLNYDVPVIAATGEEAIRQAGETRPALVLMDIMLAGEIDGVEAAAQIWKHFNIPVVYLTANSDEKTLQRAKITQPFGYLLKPFEERELHTTIEMALYKHQMERKLKESERWLTTTLKSIGDGVIATDIEGHIKFMNPVAEALTGWPEAEALGRNLMDTFRIIDEESGSLIEKPVAVVYQEGDVVNLASRSMLLARDNTERPIDGITAPIKNDENSIIGVVVAFRDITERKQAEEALQKARDRLEIQVAERTADLKMTNEQLQIELTERKRAEEALAKQAKELARSNAELEQFAYVASHDLREPLRKIKSYTELLERRYKGQLDAKADKYISYVVDGAARMQRLITDLLTYSRVGRNEMVVKQTDLNTVLCQVKEDLEVAIRENKAVITHDPLPTLMADAGQMAQLLQNLIGNAIKFRNEVAPQVHISAEQQHSEWVFSVRDNGIGIELQYAERIFLIFQRLHGRGEYPGTGIGLAICKKILERHNGRIWVEPGLGKGTTFYFALPVS